MSKMAQLAQDFADPQFIVQSIMTLILIGLVSYLTIVDRSVSDQIWSIIFTIVGFWFGTQVNRAAARGNDSPEG